MSRRRRRIRNRRGKKKPNKWLILVQLLVLAGVLVFLFGFRDYLAMSASSMVNSVAGSDLDVKKKKGERAEQTPPNKQPKLETPAQPAVEVNAEKKQKERNSE